LNEAKLKVMSFDTKQTKLLLRSKGFLQFGYKKLRVLGILKKRRMFRMAISNFKSKLCQDPGYNGVVVLSHYLIKSIKSVNSVNLFDSFYNFISFNSNSVDNSAGSYSWVPCPIQNRDAKAICETQKPKVKIPFYSCWNITKCLDRPQSLS
jgi:hypothetical protein